IIDYVPDVAVGRLACRYGFEVDIMVDKIIEYESSACDPSWFKKMICIAGDTFVPGINGDHSGVAEGEIECDHAASFLEPLGFDIEKLYTSDGSFSGPSDVTNSISNGAGFVIFAGHGSPSTWGNHPPEDDNFTTGLQLRHMQKLRNSEKLPIVVVGGCHNSQFNVTFLNFVKGIRTEGKAYFDEHFWHKTWVPECWSWWLVRKIGGGSIASFGSTGLGYGYVGNHSDIDGDGIDEPDCLEGLGGYVEITFFRNYDEGIEVLGDLWSATMTDYLDVFPSMGDKIQMKQIQEWPILGDPSLMIGGYS
ncbi:MAG: peptidase C25, partial [Thermoplasmatales archaeon]|nr:peptidase C25 [Thermoplasmatales archaeon]